MYWNMWIKNKLQMRKMGLPHLQFFIGIGKIDEDLSISTKGKRNFCIFALDKSKKVSILENRHKNRGAGGHPRLRSEQLRL